MNEYVVLNKVYESNKCKIVETYVTLAHTELKFILEKSKLRMKMESSLIILYILLEIYNELHPILMTRKIALILEVRI